MLQQLATSTSSLEPIKPMKSVSELPEPVIKQLIKIAETCVIKSSRISRDETPDFVQNCLLKLLMQFEDERVMLDEGKNQYYIARKSGGYAELEPWFGSIATNISIDYYRRARQHISLASHNEDEDNSYEENISESIFAPEPGNNLDENLRREKVQEMSYFCAISMDDCFDETWDFMIKDNYKNFSISFTENALIRDKGQAVANYCRITLNEKYNNDGKKLYSHDVVCKSLGIDIKPENIAHKKKKFEQLLLECINGKVNKEFNNSTSEWLEENI